jgi:hypothetical protein
VKVAADVVARQQLRRLAAERLFAQLRRTERHAELRVHVCFGRGVRQLA